MRMMSKMYGNSEDCLVKYLDRSSQTQAIQSEREKERERERDIKLTE